MTPAAVNGTTAQNQTTEYFDQDVLVKLRDAERNLPTPEASRQLFNLIGNLNSGEMMYNKMVSAYDELTRVVKTVAPADAVGYLKGHPIEEIVFELNKAQKALTPQDVCVQILVRSAQIAEVNHDHFQVRVSGEYGAAIGKLVGDILFQSTLAATQSVTQSSEPKRQLATSQS